MSAPGEWETGFTSPLHEQAHALALKHGGRFHGPHIEHLSISEQGFYALVGELQAEIDRVARDGPMMDDHELPDGTPVTITMRQVLTNAIMVAEALAERMRRRVATVDRVTELERQNKMLRDIIELVMRIPDMTDAELEQLKANCRQAMLMPKDGDGAG